MRTYHVNNVGGEARGFLAAHSSAAAVAASVNPTAEPLLVEMCFESGLSAPLYAGRDFPTGVEMAVENPAAVGIDRILNVKAAFGRSGAACAAVDFGTATSISVADGRGHFVGGAIMPGMAVALRALEESTALLPAVTLALPGEALGGNTAAAMLSGCVFGTLGATKEIISRINAELGTDLKVFVTGGDAKFLSPIVPAGWTTVGDLTFEGLRLAYDERR
jgi:type III pantothenate kinase